MEDLVFPGFEQLGVSTRAAKDWLAHR